jgi:outer membrane protein OmpA-like peptidoglycan-associated protein
MTRTLLTLVVASLMFGCTTTVRVAAPPPAAEVSGRWVGTWKALDAMNTPRQGQIDLDLTQDGGHGRGRIALTDTSTTEIPESLRLAGSMGAPIVFAVHGTSMVLRHERAAREFTMQLKVDEDDIVGGIPGPLPVEIRLTRIERPGQLTTGERLGRLEYDGSRERERLNALSSRVNGLAIETDEVKSAAGTAADLARQALAATGEVTTRSITRLEELERLVREAGANGHSGNGAAHRSVVHTLDVRFGFDKSDVDDNNAQTLTEIVELLKENPEISAELEGYADALGKSDYNVRLSQRRVEAVHRHLAKHGVPLERLHIVGFGQLPESAPEERAKNRRVTIKLLLGDE